MKKLHLDHWTILYCTGTKRYVECEETAKSEALINPYVVGIRAPIYSDTI